MSSASSETGGGTPSGLAAIGSYALRNDAFRGSGGQRGDKRRPAWLTCSEIGWEIGVVLAPAGDLADLRGSPLHPCLLCYATLDRSPPLTFGRTALRVAGVQILTSGSENIQS